LIARLLSIQVRSRVIATGVAALFTDAIVRIAFKMSSRNLSATAFCCVCRLYRDYAS
jgi:hypothetical protein